MHIGVLGGSFDPPHLGHIAIVHQIRKLQNLDQIWFIPCFQHPFAKQLSPAKDRLAMTKLVEDDAILVSDWEIKQKTISYSIDTLSFLSQKYHHTFSWIIGSDQLPTLYKWKDWKKIVEEYGIIVFPRGEAFPQTKYLQSGINIIAKEKIVVSSISSSMIRQHVNQGLPIKTLVTESVEHYIIKHNLYRT